MQIIRGRLDIKPVKKGSKKFDVVMTFVSNTVDDVKLIHTSQRFLNSMFGKCKKSTGMELKDVAMDLNRVSIIVKCNYINSTSKDVRKKIRESWSQLKSEFGVTS